MEIKNRVYWIGAMDPQLRTFDIVLKTENGTTYNSYLIKGENKIALIETVKRNFADFLLSKLEKLIDPYELDYIILNHLEPDHSGALSEVLNKANNAKVVISKNGRHFLKNIINKDIDYIVVEEGDTIELGGKTLRFISAPFLHWPDSMFTYLEEDRILFTCDFLGAHYCDERLFDDLMPDFTHSFKYYFQHILRPFKEYVLKALDKIEQIEIEMVCPSHGPIIRKNIKKWMEIYRELSTIRDSKEKEIVIFYVSNYGNTEKMAKEIANGVLSNGVKVSLVDILGVDNINNILDKVESSDALIIGSPTINGGLLKPVSDVISSLALIKVKGKIGAAFGSYGWSGEAVDIIEELLRRLKLKLPIKGIKAILIPNDKDLENCREFGKSIAKEVKNPI
jgi:flavorubredoxin